jgi:hypothetical protein
MLADKYNVLDLQQVCIDYMCCHFVSLVAVNKAVTWYQYAKIIGHTQLKQTCYEFIKWNFHKVASSDDFYNIEMDLLLDLLKSSDLVVPDEYTLFQLISNWIHVTLLGIENKPDSEEAVELDISAAMEKQLLLIFSSIRFPMMSLENLCRLQKNSFTNHFQECFISKISLAMKFHTCSFDHRDSSFNLDSIHLFEPRLYTNDFWSTGYEIDNYSGLPQNCVQPLVFRGPVSGSQADENKMWEWQIDLYPKGIYFQKCIMVNLWRKVEVSGVSLATVRMSFKSKHQNCRAEINTMVTGSQDGVEYVKKVVTRRCFFDRNQTLLNIDNLIPFEDLNVAFSPYLVGKDRNTFKFRIFVKSC